MGRKFARIPQQTKDTETHGQVVIATLKLEEQPPSAQVNQNRYIHNAAEKVPVCISDGFTNTIPRMWPCGET